MASDEKFDLVERLLRKRGATSLVSDAERPIATVLGEHYLSRSADRDWLDVALNDLHCIKEMRPDLGDAEVAYLVRTADDDEEDAEAWMQRVMSFDPSTAELV
jgi:hypothetical protein